MASTTISFTLQLTGPLGSHSIPLVKEVNRIGSLDSCEVPIDVQSPHVATLICLKDTVEIINRTKTPLVCGKISIPCGGRVSWSVGQTLRIEKFQLSLTSSRVADSRTRNTTETRSDTQDPASKLSSPGKSNRALLLTAGVISCSVIFVMLMSGGPDQTAKVGQKDELADCVAELQRKIDEHQPAAESHMRLSLLGKTVLGVHAHGDGRGLVTNRIKVAVEHCEALLNTIPESAPAGERRLTERFISLLRENSGELPYMEDPRFRASLESLSQLLEQQRLGAEMYSRLTSMADVLSRYRMVKANPRFTGNVERRDAVCFCRSLMESVSREVSAEERSLAKRLAALVADGA